MAQPAGSPGLTFNLVTSPSFTALVGLAVGLGMAWPLKDMYRSLDSSWEKFVEWLQEKKWKLSVSAAVFVLTTASLVYGYRFPLSGIFNLSFQASSTLFFPLQLIYANLAGENLAALIFNYSRWYLHLLWLYLIIGIATDLAQKVIRKESFPRPF